MSWLNRAQNPGSGRGAHDRPGGESSAGLLDNSAIDKDDDDFEFEYDQENLEWARPTTTSRWATRLRRCLPRRLPRVRKATGFLLLIDFVIIAVLVHIFSPLITLLLRNEELFGSRLALPVNAAPLPGGPVDDSVKIPRVFHQTSATSTIPDKWLDLQKSCKDAYSDFEYMHWTDDSARDFIAKEYPWFVDTWDNYPFPIQRADAIRYFVLYHYGGLYLDMDTLCNETIPFDRIEADGAKHHTVFKATTPTGVSNDLMIASLRHPAFKAALDNILFFNDVTQPWAHLIPHAAIMISAGPFFITQVLKNWLLEQPSTQTPYFSVVNATELAPYITDLEDSSWHKGDTQVLMWVGDHSWVWYALGAVGLAIGMRIINWALLRIYRNLAKSLAS